MPIFIFSPIITRWQLYVGIVTRVLIRLGQKTLFVPICEICMVSGSMSFENVDAPTDACLMLILHSHLWAGSGELTIHLFGSKKTTTAFALENLIRWNMYKNNEILTHKTHSFQQSNSSCIFEKTSHQSDYKPFVFFFFFFFCFFFFFFVFFFVFFLHCANFRLWQ